jgi:hypothetical protein
VPAPLHAASESSQIAMRALDLQQTLPARRGIGKGRWLRRRGRGWTKRWMIDLLGFVGAPGFENALN